MFLKSEKNVKYVFSNSVSKVNSCRKQEVLTLGCYVWEALSKDLLFLLIVDNDQMCSRVQSAAKLASWLPLKIYRSQVIAEVCRWYVCESGRTSRHCNMSKPLLGSKVNDFRVVSWRVRSADRETLTLYPIHRMGSAQNHKKIKKANVEICAF